MKHHSRSCAPERTLSGPVRSTGLHKAGVSDMYAVVYIYIYIDNCVFTKVPKKVR